MPRLTTLTPAVPSEPMHARTQSSFRWLVRGVRRVEQARITTLTKMTAMVEKRCTMGKGSISAGGSSRILLL
jgi:hypothetical protein